MEATELKQIWKQYDAKLERSWNLNLKLVNDLNLNKAKTSLSWFAFFNGVIILVDIFLVHFLSNFIINNFSNITLTLPAYLLVAASFITMIWSSHQLGYSLMISYSKPVIEIQKKIEYLRTQKLRFNKFIFYISYPYVYLMGFTFLHLDITLFPIKWMLPNIILVILWIPLCSWLIKKYNTPNLKSSFWKSMSKDSTLTPDSASRTLTKSLRFLKEIKDFEQNQGNH